jgi:gliding motility-associated-like protein
MKQFYKYSILILLLLTSAFSSTAQLANPAYEVEYTIHYDSYDGVDLTGYVTYEVYLRFENPDNYLLAIFGEEDPAPDCIFDPVQVTYFNFPCGLFQSETETAFGHTNNCLYEFGLPGFAADEWDSYMALGMECSSDFNCEVISDIGNCPTWLDEFEGPTNGDPFDGGSFFWDSHALFSIPLFDPTCSATYVGDDLRIKVAQFTSCGGFDGCLSISYRDPNDNAVTVNDICMQVPHPCIDFPLDTEPLVTSPACPGDESLVVVDDGGFSTVTYSLYSGNTPGAGTLVQEFTNSDNGFTLAELEGGDYYYTMLEGTGCRDTSVVFTIVDPEPIDFDATLLNGVNCFGETTGEIEVVCTGGTGVLDFSVNGQGNNACGTVLSNLACGNYVILATDDNGCTATETIDIPCPPNITYNLTSTDIACFDYDDGTITGPVNGGTGLITATLTLGLDEIGVQSATGALNVNFTDLDGGDYVLTIADANGCGDTFNFSIFEPDAVVVTPTTSDASCFGFCDGTVIFDITGGVGPFDENVLNAGNVEQVANALCAGNYSYDIVDANGCSLTGNIVIGQPTQIVFNTAATATLCNGSCDGSIAVTNVAGGEGGYAFSGSGGIACDAPCSGTSANFSGVCAGSYTVTVTDQTGCEVEATNVVVASPQAIVLTIAPTNVTCFGFANGEAAITATGGTGALTLQPTNLPLPQTVADLAPGTFTFTVLDENGCEASDDVIITEPPLLQYTITEAINVTCGGECDGTILYQVSGGTTPYTFQLLPDGVEAASSGIIGNICAGTYDLVIRDLNDCESTQSVTINEPAPLEILVDLDAPTCTGMTDGEAAVVVQGGTGLLSVDFLPASLDVTDEGNNLYTINDLGELTLNIILEDGVGCVEELEIEVVPDIITDMVLTTFSSPESCWNTQDGTATVGVQNGNLPISYQWFDSEMQITPTAIGLLSNDTYTVRVTDDIGCTLTTSVFVEPTIGCFFITNAITPNGDGANDTWILGGLEFFPDANIEVFNRWGQQVFQSTGYAAPWDGQYRGQLLPVADYYFIIEYDKSKDPIIGTLTIKY